MDLWLGRVPPNSMSVRDPAQRGVELFIPSQTSRGVHRGSSTHCYTDGGRMQKAESRAGTTGWLAVRCRASGHAPGAPASQNLIRCQISPRVVHCVRAATAPGGRATGAVMKPGSVGRMVRVLDFLGDSAAARHLVAVLPGPLADLAKLLAVGRGAALGAP